MKSIVIDTGLDYCYLYSFKMKRLIIIDNVIGHYVKLYLTNGMSSKSVCREIYRKEKERYKIRKKFNFFLDQGFLDAADNITVNGSLSENDIEMAKSNLETITFELTKKCNLNCTYCVYNDMYESSEENIGCEMNLATAKAVLDYFFALFNGGNSISEHKTINIGFYGGEPLLRFDLISDIVNYVEKLKNDRLTIAYNITTNGLLLDKYVDFLAFHNFNILISLDGNSECSSYRKTRNGTDSFITVYKNAQCLCEKYPDFFAKRVRFNTVLHDKNPINKSVLFIKEKFNKIPMISTLTRTNLRKDRLNAYKMMYRDLTLDIEKYKGEIGRHILADIDPAVACVYKFIESHIGYNFKHFSDMLFNRNSNYLPTGSCSPFNFKLFVSADGKFHPCEKVGYEYSLGYVSSNNRVIIDNAKILKKYNEQYYEKIRAKCEKCYRIQSCPICVFHDGLDCTPFDCEMIVKYFKFIIHTIEEYPGIFLKTYNIQK